VYHWNKFRPASTKTALQLFQQATERDSNFALAHAWLANAFITLALGTGVDPEAPEQAFPKAKAAAARALQLDNSLSDAQASLGVVHFMYERDWPAAELAFQSLKLLENTTTQPSIKYGLFKACSGKHDEGIQAVQEALELDPVSLISNAHLAHQYYWARQPEEAIEHYTRTLELNEIFPPARVGLAWCLLQSDKVDAATKHFAIAARINQRSSRVLASLGCAYATAGRIADSTAIRDELVERRESTDVYTSCHDIALLSAWLGDRQAALSWLEQGFKDRASWISFLNVDPMWDALRDEPRFRKVVQDIGLVHS